MSILFNGFVLGWSVAWPPGPVNAEMIRRGLLPREQGGGFWETWRVGLGACTGDFIWALAVAAGAGALLTTRVCALRSAQSAWCFCSFSRLYFLAPPGKRPVARRVWTCQD